ncbi:metalloregulator ArsR/SmtB family transcription factor [Marinicella sp. S1101]|uniref:metalloregulator ArsR/SmtB family transcription factor n=1 Tax=Marinicella marina TaxID=2996016 RepID=UPI00226082EB|nr:metalloregulator ArsR/SmtB family transcription factor [Marinicella marina]MCX7552594.1 metalloregulator ArsR/SmtB family transcription factor [Marinicella marina]MDJ1139470.1 metalloregulator ArsR/SmtB family transcription factor [Marinicella marina]
MNDTFQALSSSVRRKILAYLSKTDLTAGEISERFEMSKPALSKHLSILMNAGLIQGEKKGQYVHYSLVKENLFANMNDFLVNFCPQGRPLKLESAEIKKNKKTD